MKILEELTDSEYNKLYDEFEGEYSSYLLDYIYKNYKDSFFKESMVISKSTNIEDAKYTYTVNIHLGLKNNKLYITKYDNYDIIVDNPTGNLLYWEHSLYHYKNNYLDLAGVEDKYSSCDGPVYGLDYINRLYSHIYTYNEKPTTQIINAQDVVKDCRYANDYYNVFLKLSDEFSDYIFSIVDDLNEEYIDTLDILKEKLMDIVTFDEFYISEYGNEIDV